MNTAMTVIVLLVCSDVICMTQGRGILNPRCRCPKVHAGGVNISLIRTLTHYPPRSHCSKEEVIVTLKTRGPLCLDPNGKFAKTLIERQIKENQQRQKQRSIETLSPHTNTST
ncbi:growth-regulated alpha protein-like [Salvelinus namaycush]|uniref:Growth-regulated alpha protein-like n=1 Tax=Salvelinus namaycush TaxID=8040 RepID=A0A8U0PU04_SALNM|nr:growth-regulated alpha protein-like [Salvelinus namaycush]XP_038841135.1 growth-regulated alpha protein-like [Salvelinus namaycush]